MTIISESSQHWKHHVVPQFQCRKKHLFSSKFHLRLVAFNKWQEITVNECIARQKLALYIWIVFSWYELYLFSNEDTTDDFYSHHNHVIYNCFISDAIHDIIAQSLIIQHHRRVNRLSIMLQKLRFIGMRRKKLQLRNYAKKYQLECISLSKC